MRRRRYRRLFRLALFRADVTRAEIDEEVRFHLEARAEQLMRQGLSPSDAQAEALRRFTQFSGDARPLSDSAIHKERHLRLRDWFDSLQQDATFALRSIRRQRTFSGTVLLTLAIAIGACTAVFGVTYSVVLRRLPFRIPERIVSLENVSASFTPSGVTIRKSVAQHPLVEAASLYMTGGSAIVGETNPTRAAVTQASARFFDVLGVAPVAGRTFAPDESEPGRNQVAVVSHGFWMRALGGDSAAIGRAISASGHRLVVVGVMPPRFEFPAGTELWVPLPQSFGFFNGAHGWSTIARLRTGVQPATLRAALSTMFADQARKAGRTFEDDVAVIPLQAEMAASVRRTLFTLLGAVGLVLLVACANIASLWGARGLARGRELAIRQALGAGRRRLSRLIVVEALMLSTAGAVAGIVIAGIAERILVANAPLTLPRAGEIGLHGPVLLFGVILGVGAGVLCALLPLRRVSDAALNTSILGRPRAGSGRAGWTTGTPLIAAEVALASLLTVGAGLLIRSYVNAERMSLGIDASGVLTARIDLPHSDTLMATRDATLATLIDALRAIPGTRQVAVTNDLPLIPRMLSAYRVGLVSAPRTDSARGFATVHAVTPHYFEALGVPLRSGRDFSSSDRSGAPHVFIVNDSLRRRLVGDRDVVGMQVVVGKQDTGIVVGVVGDIRHHGPEKELTPQVYRPFSQSAETAFGFVIRGSNSDAAAMAPLVRQTVARVAPRLAAYELVPMERLTSRVMAPRRFVLALLVSFAGIALLLTAIGVYGVVSYSVDRRTREIGVRAALGARFGNLLALTLRRSLLASIAGVAIALVAVVPLRSTLAHLLFGVSPLDPITLITVGLTTLGVATAASLLPGVRAARVDPAQVLRSDG